MKNFKSIVLKVVIILAACFMFASFSPSLDGRVVVTEPGEFPQGLFAKTVGYLPGDIISVADILGENTVDLLVIGALDPSEGVAIMITPEAAQAIGIDKDSNNIVKITKRSGQDERVYGTAVITRQNLSQFENENSVESEENENGFEDEQSEINETEFDENQEDEFLEEENYEFEAEILQENENPESNDEESEIFAEETEEFFEEEPFTEEESEKTDDKIEEESEVPFEDEISEKYEESELVEEEFEPEAEEPIESEKIEEEIPDLEQTEEIPAEPFDEDEFESEIIETKNEEVEILQEEIPAQKDFEEEPIDDYTGEELVEDLLNNEFVQNDKDKTESAENEKTDDSEQSEIPEDENYEYEEDEYAAIVLVPVDSMPPVSEETEIAENSEVFKNADFDEATPESTETVLQPQEQNEITEIQPTEKTEFSYEKYLAESLRDLESGKYYIQIATLSLDTNILEIINKYANNYPIVIVPTASGIRKQILIGPLSVDEYALVLERFKSYGYKDAFLRKIK